MYTDEINHCVGGCGLYTQSLSQEETHEVTHMHSWI